MANNDTDVPRCRVCGQYMAFADGSKSVRVYECCGTTRVVRASENKLLPQEAGGVRV